jgi:hypothetical protein
VSTTIRFTSILLLLLTAGAVRSAFCQEPPYFVTYSHAMEEPDNLEINYKGNQGSPPNGNPFVSSTVEFEYGARAWWTTEVYLSGQTTENDSTLFTGFRWENRFRILPREHWINPVFYVEYEDTNFADRSLLEITGNASIADYAIPNSVARKEIEREMEYKLILSSNVRGWNFSENFISEKAFSNEPWEFGYALGASRPLKSSASGNHCLFCRENFSGGAELYGGLGTANGFGLHATSQYFGPTAQWQIPKGPAILFSPNFGLNDNSLGVLWRFSASYEIQQLTSYFRRNKQ